MRTIWLVIVVVVVGGAWINTALLGGSYDGAIITILAMIALTLAGWTAFDGQRQDTRDEMIKVIAKHYLNAGKDTSPE
jgi:hypothetical protein